MGFRLNRRYVLVFEGDLAGLEVAIKATPIGVVLQLLEAVSLESATALLAEYLDEWNYEDADGNPVPTTKAGIEANLEEAVLGQIRREWFKAAKGVTAPLRMTSTDGGPSVEEETDLSTLLNIPAQALESQAG